MHARECGANVRYVPLWLLTIVICVVAMVVGTVVVAVGAIRLVRREPD